MLIFKTEGHAPRLSHSLGFLAILGWVCVDAVLPSRLLAAPVRVAITSHSLSFIVPIIAQQKGFYRDEGSDPFPSTFPVLHFYSASFEKRDEPIVFYFDRSAFEKRMENERVDAKRQIDVSSQTNSLASYMFATIYAEQLAHGEKAGKLSAAEMKLLNERGLIVNRRSALIETHEYFRQMSGQSPETQFVEIVLKNSKHF